MLRVPRAKLSDDDIQPLPVGRYLLEIDEAKLDQDGDSPALKVYSTVISGPAEPGTPSLERFSLSPAAVFRIGILVKRLGLVERGDALDDAEFDEQELVGKRVVAQLEEHSFVTKKGKEVQTTQWKEFWAEGDPRAEGKRLPRQGKPPHPSRVTSPLGGVLPQAPAGVADDI